LIRESGFSPTSKKDGKAGMADSLPGQRWRVTNMARPTCQKSQSLIDPEAIRIDKALSQKRANPLG
jgi:hypothetical protein